MNLDNINPAHIPLMHIVRGVNLYGKLPFRFAPRNVLRLASLLPADYLPELTRLVLNSQSRESFMRFAQGTEFWTQASPDRKESVILALDHLYLARVCEWTEPEHCMVDDPCPEWIAASKNMLALAANNGGALWVEVSKVREQYNAQFAEYANFRTNTAFLRTFQLGQHVTSMDPLTADLTQPDDSRCFGDKASWVHWLPFAVVNTLFRQAHTLKHTA